MPWSTVSVIEAALTIGTGINVATKVEAGTTFVAAACPRSVEANMDSRAKMQLAPTTDPLLPREREREVFSLQPDWGGQLLQPIL